MRVLVDAHMLGQRETGNETYVRGLLSGLASLHGVAVAAAVDPRFRPDARDQPSTTWLPLATCSNWHRLASGLGQLAQSWEADVLHATYIAPYHMPCPVVVSVHDVSFKRYPQHFSWRDRALFWSLLPGSLRRAAGVLTLSSHARDELRQFYPELRAPIHVVPAAPGVSFRPVSAAVADDALGRHGLRRPFLLAVGSVQPRKNLVRLVEAYGKIQQSHPDVQLVIVGPGGFHSGWVRRTIMDRGLSQSVRLLGYVPEEDLVALYNAAIALVYPSVYEGFGLPVVEAMACGRPVIASNTSSVPEVAGNAALLVDPFDVSALHAAMSRLLTDSRAAEELGARGLVQATRFSWRRTAAAAMSAYETACGVPFPMRTGS